MKRSASPFRFSTASHLVRFTGLRVRSLRELCVGLETVSGSAIFQHTYNAYLVRHFVPGLPRNEFAYWTAEVLHQRALAERLAAVDPYEFTDIRSMRERLVEVVRDHFQEGGEDAVAPAGEEFHFLESVSVLTPTSLHADDLVSFREALSRAAVRSIYHHYLTARLRLGSSTNDFSVWLAEGLGETDLARKFEQAGSVTSTLEDTRRSLLHLVDRRLATIRLRKTVGIGVLGGTLIGGVAAAVRLGRQGRGTHAGPAR
jgi:hypothetical protein